MFITRTVSVYWHVVSGPLGKRRPHRVAHWRESKGRSYLGPCESVRRPIMSRRRTIVGLMSDLVMNFKGRCSSVRDKKGCPDNFVRPKNECHLNVALRLAEWKVGPASMRSNSFTGHNPSWEFELAAYYGLILSGRLNLLGIFITGS